MGKVRGGKRLDAFFRKAAQAQRSSVKNIEVGIFDPTLAARATANEFGAALAGRIQGAYISLKLPANASATLRQKEGDNPLVDTGATVDAIQVRIDEK